MTARTQILAKLKASNARGGQSTQPYCPEFLGSLWEEFVTHAKASDSVIHEIASALDIPTKLQSLFSSNGGITPLHIAQGSHLRDLPWRLAPQLAMHDTPPGGEAIVLSAADFAIAETGTLVFCSGTTQPSSWHFLPGIECVLLRRPLILQTLEDVFAQMADAAMPATLNLVTGPSRTADIEQTIERGAHGPHALHIFLTTD